MARHKPILYRLYNSIRAKQKLSIIIFIYFGVGETECNRKDLETEIWDTLTAQQTEKQATNKRTHKFPKTATDPLSGRGLQRLTAGL